MSVDVSFTSYLLFCFFIFVYCPGRWDHDDSLTISVAMTVKPGRLKIGRSSLQSESGSMVSRSLHGRRCDYQDLLPMDTMKVLCYCIEAFPWIMAGPKTPTSLAKISLSVLFNIF